jgi:predicted HTH transcriptional regulator
MGRRARSNPAVDARRDQVARYVAGFANAEGGMLMVGNRFRPVSQYPRFS